MTDHHNQISEDDLPRVIEAGSWCRERGLTVHDYESRRDQLRRVLSSLSKADQIIAMQSQGQEPVAWVYDWTPTFGGVVIQAVEQGNRPDDTNANISNVRALYDHPAQPDRREVEVLREALADAERFRALMRCGHIKMQGSSGVDPNTLERNGNNVHFGAEFWPEPPKPEYADLDGGERSRAWGRACLRHLADAILEHEAQADAIAREGEA